MTDRRLDPGSEWKHSKRGTRYRILTTAESKIDENEGKLLVVYQGLDDGGKVWVRPVDNFLEKASEDAWRFEKLANAAEENPKEIAILQPTSYDPPPPEVGEDEEIDC